MAFAFTDPTYNVKLISNSNDFVIDNLGRVIYVGGISGQGLREALSIDIIVKRDGQILESQVNFEVIGIDIDMIDKGQYESI